MDCDTEFIDASVDEYLIGGGGCGGCGGYEGFLVAGCCGPLC